MKNKILHVLSITCGAFLLLATAPSFAVTYHVATTGDDGNDGLGWDTAKATIQGGVNAAAAEGDVVLVAAERCAAFR